MCLESHVFYQEPLPAETGAGDDEVRQGWLTTENSSKIKSTAESGGKSEEESTQILLFQVGDLA